MNHIRITAILLLLLAPLASRAQQSIDSVVKSIEKSKSVTNEVYSERRNPSTKEIVSADNVFEFTDNKLADKLIDAIRHERDNATAYQKVNQQDNKLMYTITFQKDNSYSKYTLIQLGASKWMLSVKKSISSKKQSVVKSRKKIRPVKRHTHRSSKDEQEVETLVDIDDGVLAFSIKDGNVKPNDIRRAISLYVAGLKDVVW